MELVGLKGQWGRSGLECMPTSWTTEIADLEWPSPQHTHQAWQQPKEPSRHHLSIYGTPAWLHC